MTRIGDIGTPAIVNTNSDLAFYVSLALIRVVVKDVNIKYLYYYIQSHNFKRELYKRTIHNAFPIKINKNEIGKCLVILKNIYEQTYISDLLSLIDKKLSLAISKIEALKKYRKGLLKIVCKHGCVCLLGEVLREEIHKTKINNEHPIISSTSEGVFLQKDYFNHQVASNNNIG